MIKKIKNLKIGVFKIYAFLLTAPVLALAGSSDDAFAEAGTSTQKTVSAAIQNWLWLSPFVILAPVFYGIYRENALVKKEAKGQDAEQTDSLKHGLRLFKGALYGAAFSFIIVTLIGKVFLGMDIGDTWNLFMIKPIKSLLGLS